MNPINRFKGCLLGLAIGDAVGTTLELQRPEQFEPINDMIGGGPFELNPGEWTDDTSMALCLAQSLIDCKDFDPYDQMDKYSEWLKNGYMSSRPGECVDIGNATHQALYRYEDDYQPFCGNTARNSAGNGSIMRLAPVPMFYANSMEKTIEKSGISSKTTHCAPQSIDGARYFGYLLYLALLGSSKEIILTDYSSSSVWQDLPLDSEIAEVAAGSFKDKSPPEIVGSGYVVKSLEAALWAFFTTDNFKDGLLKAVNLGNDADTTGAVYGQLAGAYYGVDDIPVHWLSKLFMKPEIERMATTLYEFSHQQPTP